MITPLLKKLLMTTIMGLATNAFANSGDTHQAEQRPRDYIGIATDTDNNELLYKEIHCLFDHGSETIATVYYIRPNNDLFAHKDITLGTSLSGKNIWVPNYAFSYYPIGYKEAINLKKKNILLKRKDSSQQPWLQNSLPIDGFNNPLVADAGFDLFIKDHFSDFVRGKSFEVTYLSAPRLTSLSFKLEPTRQSDTELVIKIKPANFFIGLLVDPIYVAYHKESKNILRFTGLTNVPKNKDEHYVANIKYEYQENLDEFCG